MAIFYYNGTAAQGTADGSSAANASNSSSAAIAALSGGVEVTAGTFSLTAAQASSYTITGAGTVSISDPVTVAQANSLDGNISATLSLSSISDTAANLSGSSDAVLGLGTTVTASTTATAAQATTIGGFTKAVTYSISDTATLVAGAGTTALNEAVNITVTGTATVAQATTIDAATTGNNALIDNALADLTVTARGLTASNTANDISIGGVGDVQATASLSGRSTASTVLGDRDALAALKATGLEALSAGFTATIGQQGDFSAAATVGSVAAPLLVEAISAASGDATVQAASTAIGILGTFAAPDFSSLQAGAAQGDISGSASADLNLRAIAVDGVASVSLGTADIFGIKDMALTTGAEFSQINATALGQATLLAQTVDLAATSAGSTSSRGLFSSAASALPVNFSENGRISAIAQQSSFSQSISVNGTASSSLSNDSLGIGNALITVGAAGSLDVRAISLLDNRAQSVTSAASA